MTDDITGEWLECIVDNDYQIFSEYPHSIRRKGTDRIIKESISKKDGYVQCSMNQKKYQKHRIIALQFIDNPENLPQIDHINHNRTDNRIENLRFVSASVNQKNKSSNKGHHYKFLDELPESAESLDAYNGHEFDGLFVDYENKKLYIFNGVKYRELVPCRITGNIYYRFYDIEDRRTALSHKVLFG